MQLVHVSAVPLSAFHDHLYFNASPPKAPKFELPDFTYSFPEEDFQTLYKRADLDKIIHKFAPSPPKLANFKDPLIDLIAPAHWGDIMGFFLEKDDIIITRPLNELFCVVKNRKLPSLELIARVIKTLALSIFRWHLCDGCIIKQGDHVIHSLDGRLSIPEDLEDFKSKHPYLLESAYVLILKSGIKKEHSKIVAADNITPDYIREYFYDCYKLEITDKVQGNSISDFFKSVHFDLKNGQDVFV